MPSREDRRNLHAEWCEELEQRANGVPVNDADGEVWDNLRQRLAAELGG